MRILLATSVLTGILITGCQPAVKEGTSQPAKAVILAPTAVETHQTTTAPRIHAEQHLPGMFAGPPGSYQPTKSLLPTVGEFAAMPDLKASLPGELGRQAHGFPGVPQATANGLGHLPPGFPPLPTGAGNPLENGLPQLPGMPQNLGLPTAPPEDGGPSSAAASRRRAAATAATTSRRSPISPSRT